MRQRKLVILGGLLLIGMVGINSCRPNADTILDKRDKTLICPVHNQQLHEDIVRIGYGLRSYPPGYLESQRKQFPHANLDYDGGCEVSDNSPRRAKMRYCSECRKAEQKWEEENK